VTRRGRVHIRPMQQVRFQIEGLAETAGAGPVEAVLRAVPGVADAAVNPGTGRAEVRFDAPATRDSLAAALERAGHPVRRGQVVLDVAGMTCAACTGRVERVLAAQGGVAGAVANLATRRAVVTLWEPVAVEGLVAAVARAGYAATPLATRAPHDPAAEERAIWARFRLAAGLTLPVSAVEMAGHLVPGLHHRIAALGAMQALWGAEFVLILLVLVGPGRGFFLKGGPSLWRGAPDMNALVAVGAGAAFAFSAVATFLPGLLPAPVVYYESAGVIVVLILLGRALEARARGRAGQAIARLVGLQPKGARVWRDGGFVEVPVAALLPGMRVQVRPGERVPVDGVVVEGASAVDEAMLTGEPLAVAKGPGCALTGGTVNGTGGLVMEVRAVGAATTLARIVALVEAAQGGKLPVQALVDRITRWFVPAVMAVAGVTVALWLVLGPGVGPAMVAGVSVLIIACPCAMGLAVPVSILVGSGRAAEMGVLFRGGAALQRLAGVGVVAFDKTGTLTVGRPGVVRVWGDVLALAAAVERGSEHPLAAAVLAEAARQGVVVPEATGFVARPGLGAEAVVAGVRVAVGAARMFEAVPADLVQAAGAAAAAGHSVVFVARGGEVAGLIEIADQIRPGAAEAVAALRALGLRVALVTGDTAAAAGVVARALGIGAVHAAVLPEGKLDLIRGMGGGVAFVGDGINDAPALAAADVGLAMGQGSDVAIEAGDVVLMTGAPGAVGDAVRLARAVMANIRQNLIWAFGYNVLLIPVAAGALVPFGGPPLSPMLAAAAMAVSSVFVVMNALRLRRFRAAR